MSRLNLVLLLLIAFSTTVAAQRFTGLVAAVFSGFDENHQLELETVEAQINLLVKGGVETAYVCGTTGESLSLTSHERKLLAEKWVKLGHSKGIKVIIHVGHECIDDAVDLAKHAEAIGADAFAAMPPVFLKPSNTQHLIATMSLIAQAAPSLPFFYYHIPEMTGSNPVWSEFMSEMKKLNNFRGVKYTDMDLMTYQELINYDDGKFDILFGKDQMLLSALAVGAKGAVGSNYNFVGKQFNWIIGNYTVGQLDKAQEVQRWAGKMITWFLANDLMPVLKATMDLLGCSVGPPRPPIFPLTSEKREELKKLLVDLHLL